MAIVYLDIETTGLDFSSDQIISIQYQENNNHFEILKSWETSEEQILIDFLNKVTSIQDNQFVICVGFNTLCFDIPFLISRYNYYKIRTPNEIIGIFNRKLAHCDLKQIYLPFNNWRYKGLTWDNVLDEYGYQMKDGSNSQVPIWFENGDYERILRYIESEFPPMVDIYWKLRNSIFKKTMNTGGE